MSTPMPVDAMRHVLRKLADGGNMTVEEARMVGNVLLRGEADPVEVAAVLTAMRVRGETGEEVAGLAMSLRDNAVRVPLDVAAIDTAGTGGDGSGTINLSTAAAIVASAAGAYVAKHGNRSVTGVCGSADLMEALGYRLDIGPDVASRALRRVRFAFLYAPNYHPAMRNVMPVRRKLPFGTAFNLVGPLSNPAMVKRQVLGVSSPRYMDVIGGAALMLGYDHLLIVHGEPGIDEVSPQGATRVLEVRNRNVEEYVVVPEDLSAPRVEVPRATSREEAVELTLKGLRGEHKGAATAISVNAAAALYVAGVASNLRDGYELAIQTIQEGRAYRHVKAVVESSHEG